MPNFAQMREQYLELFGVEGVPPSAIDNIEDRLGVSLPNDLKEIATFYGGGILGAISHHALAVGPADNVVEETLRLRAAVALPHQYVVLAEPTDSLIVLDCQANGDAAVIWCDAHELGKLPAVALLTSPNIWPTYGDFFGYLLQGERASGHEALG